MPNAFHLQWLAFACAASTAAAAPWQVATLHPLLTDLAKQVGGEQVEVIDLLGPTGDPHHFEPSQATLARAVNAKVYLVAGMGLEAYLPALRSVLGSSATVVEIGKDLPSLTGTCQTCEHPHAGAADAPALDPHWWHSIDLFRRATTIVATAFAAADPTHAVIYQQRATAYRARLDELERWARRQFARVPRERRNLATAHDAFRYLCRDFNLTASPVQGINREQTPDARELAALIAKLRAGHISVVFPERESNPKILAAITADTGIRLGPPLFADGTQCASYEAMMRHNVATIVGEWLKQP